MQKISPNSHCFINYANSKHVKLPDKTEPQLNSTKELILQVTVLKRIAIQIEVFYTVTVRLQGRVRQAYDSV